MAVFIWKERFSVGIKNMDEQHIHFLNLLNRLDDEIHRDSGAEMVEAAINKLLNYASFHFRDEEKLLLTRGYPDTEKQRREHAFFVRQVKEMEASHMGGDPVRMASVVSFLRDWFIYHITMEDKKYAAFMSIRSPGERLYAAAC